MSQIKASSSQSLVGNRCSRTPHGNPPPTNYKIHTRININNSYYYVTLHPAFMFIITFGSPYSISKDKLAKKKIKYETKQLTLSLRAVATYYKVVC